MSTTFDLAPEPPAARALATRPAGGAPDGPIAQSVAIGFVALRVFTLLLALGWLSANVRPIPPGTQAVVVRFGRVVAVQQAGLLWAWPRPLETVVRLPSAERQMALPIAVRGARVPGILDEFTAPEDVPVNAGAYLTGDGAVVLLDATITWRIADAGAYYLARDHVAPALRRVFEAAAVQVAASRPLDDFLAVRPERAADPSAEAARDAVRGDLVAAMNWRLLALSAAETALGVEVTRADVTALLPPSAKSSFDAVLDATQRAEQGLATARTEAARIRQRAERERDTVLTTAHAAAEERVAVARAGTAQISALEAQAEAAARPGLLDQLYRERIGAILGQAASVSAVDARSVGRLILPGVP